MQRIKPVPGVAYKAGVVIREDGRDRHGNVMALFRCHCGRVGRCRFTQLKAREGKPDQRKSCRCLKKLAFNTYHAAKAAEFSELQTREIFELYELDKSAATARAWGCSLYVVNFVWQRHCRTLAGKPAAHLQEVHSLAQVSVRNAGERFGYTDPEVIRIAKIVKRSHEVTAKKTASRLGNLAATEAAALDGLVRKASEEFREIAPIQSWYGNVVVDAREYLKSAVEDGKSRRFRPGELTGRELSGEHRRSDYGWLFLALRQMRTETAVAAFGPVAAEFIDICLISFERRRQRRRWAIEARIAGVARTESVATGSTADHRYLPEPIRSGRYVGRLFNKYASVIPLIGAAA